MMPSLKERSKLDLQWKGEQSYFDSFGLLQINHKAGPQSTGSSELWDPPTGRSYEAINKIKY